MDIPVSSAVVPLSPPLLRTASVFDSLLLVSRFGGLTLLSKHQDHALSLAIVVLHALAMAFSVGVARLHWLIDREPVLQLNMSFLGSSSLSFVRPVMAVMSALVVAHAALILRPLWRGRVRLLPVSPSRLQAPRYAWFERTPLQHLGLDLVDLDLLIELAFQTYQASKLSRLVGTVWINRLIAFVILANCWFTPFVHAVWWRRPLLLRQLLCGVLDSLLDLLYFMVIPLAIFLPYLRSVLPSFYFPFTMYYEDDWFVNAVAENQQLFVTSWVDFVSKMLPGATLVLRLHRLRRLLDDYRALSRRAMSKQPLTVQDARRVCRAKLSRGKRVVHALLFLWGVCVLGFHIHATTIAVWGAEPGCILEMRPWTSRIYTCSVLEISCSQRGIRGTDVELESIFRRVDVDRIYSLILSNCATLTMPPRLRALRGLVMLKIYNSSIISWDRDAALSATSHPALQVMYIVDTNLTSGIPPGMRDPDPPPALYDVEISGSDLETLPDDLEDAWRHLLYVFIERSPRLSQFPRVLGRLQTVDYLVLLANNLTGIPDDALVDLKLRLFFPGSQPLQQLPESIGRFGRLEEIGLEGTNVSTLPTSWHQRETMPGHDAIDSGDTQQPLVMLYAYGTPLCRGALLPELITNGSAALASDSSDTIVGWFRIVCGDRPISKTYFMYPLEEERRWRLRNKT
ncbi:hypothetical protein PINS_up007087 [Pythium insidiosum]|nr:hypothetical protein PINS_up007087 [Pythium insidiosum]